MKTVYIGTLLLVMMIGTLLGGFEVLAAHTDYSEEIETARTLLGGGQVFPSKYDNFEMVGCTWGPFRKHFYARATAEGLDKKSTEALCDNTDTLIQVKKPK